MKIEHTGKCIVMFFSSPRRVLSSAPYSGGFTTTDLIVNIRTSAKEMLLNPPEVIISNYLRKRSLSQRAVGFLTAAQLEYAQFVYLYENDIKILAITTAGTSNALNITEKTPTIYTGEAFTVPGTINIIIITNVHLLNDCCVSSVITATEAKSAALFDLKIKSVSSDRQATGTGTDAVAVVSGNGKTIQYAGGHTKYGQLLGEAVYTGVKGALTKRKVDYDRLPVICKEFD